MMLGKWEHNQEHFAKIDFLPLCNDRFFFCEEVI